MSTSLAAAAAIKNVGPRANAKARIGGEKQENRRKWLLRRSGMMEKQSAEPAPHGIAYAERTTGVLKGKGPRAKSHE
jgi:hypothetical protein